jgi:hypothetical protein
MDNILSSSDLCNNFHTGRMKCCAPGRLCTESKRNAAESSQKGIQPQMGWHLDWGEGWFDWSEWTKENQSLIISLEWAINYYVFYRVSQCDTAFCYNMCNSSKGLDFFPNKKNMTISQAHGYFKWSRKLNFIPLSIYTVKPSVPWEDTNILMK